MARIKKLVLDVLKPHEPNVVEFTRRLADTNHNCEVRVTVSEVDDKTESLVVVFSGENIDFDALSQALRDAGASLHSVDDVEVVSEP